MTDTKATPATDEQVAAWIALGAALLPSAIEAAALADWMRQALMGEDVSDFGQSFEPVRLAMSAVAEIERLDAMTGALCAELATARAQVETLREALREMTDAALTDSDACSICLHGTPQHSSGCAKASAEALLAATEPKG